MSSADTTFIPKQTTIPATWLQPVNDSVWKGRNPIYTVTTGSANAQVLTLPADSLGGAIATGDTFTFIAGNTTTSNTATLTVNGSASTTAVLRGGLVATNTYTVTFNGVTFDVQQYNGEKIFNVMSFGAKGDGVTDDSDAINAAVTACANAGGGKVHIPAGTFCLTFPIIMKSKVTVFGAGGGQDWVADGIGWSANSWTTRLKIIPGTVRTATELVPGDNYRIATVGSSNFITAGSNDNVVDTLFTAVGPITGTGTAQEISPAAVWFPTDVINANLSDIYIDGDRTTAQMVRYKKHYDAGRTNYTAGTFVTGLSYYIATTGTTDFTLIGASSNTPGTRFIPTGAGSGSGTAYTILPPTLHGVHMTSSIRCLLTNVSVQRVTTGIMMDTVSAKPCGFNVFKSTAIMLCNFGIRQMGLADVGTSGLPGYVPGSAVANNSFSDTVIATFFNTGYDQVTWVDSQLLTNLYLTSGTSNPLIADYFFPYTGIFINSGTPAIYNGVGGSNILNLITDLYNLPTGGDNGARGIISGYSYPGQTYVSGFISGSYQDYSLMPEQYPGSILLFNNLVNTAGSVNEYTIWRGGSKAGTNSASWDWFSNGARTMWNSQDYGKFYVNPAPSLAVGGNKRQSTKVAKIEFICRFNPGSNAGGVRLFTTVRNQVVPGSQYIQTSGGAGDRQIKLDITEGMLAYSQGDFRNPAAVLYDVDINLQTIGDGATAPIVDFAYFRVTLTDFM